VARTLQTRLPFAVLALSTRLFILTGCLHEGFNIMLSHLVLASSVLSTNPIPQIPILMPVQHCKITQSSLSIPMRGDYPVLLYNKYQLEILRITCTPHRWVIYISDAFDVAYPWHPSISFRSFVMGTSVCVRLTRIILCFTTHAALYIIVNNAAATAFSCLEGFFEQE
jgi:hypothetical protein